MSREERHSARRQEITAGATQKPRGIRGSDGKATHCGCESQHLWQLLEAVAHRAQ